MWYEQYDAGISKPANSLSAPVWRNSEDVCELADDERHLGHALRTDQWQAYDATKLNVTENGFRYLGSFVSSSAARNAIDTSVARSEKPLVRRAGWTKSRVHENVRARAGILFQVFSSNPVQRESGVSFERPLKVLWCRNVLTNRLGEPVLSVRVWEHTRLFGDYGIQNPAGVLESCLGQTHVLGEDLYNFLCDAVF